MTRILCLWLPNWPIQRLTRARPELRGRAVVLAADGPRGGRVAGCCPAAAAQGVRVGMPLAEAQALVGRVTVAQHDPAADARTLRKLAAECERFSPCVALEEGDEPESLLLDVTNLAHLFGSEAALAAKVERFFTARRYRVRMAVAGTVGAAWAAAHYGRNCKLQNANCKLKIAESEVTPGDILLAEAVRERSAFDNLHFAFCNLHSLLPQLPVDALRIAPDTVELLRELGVETVVQLLALPRGELAARFGEPLLRRVDQLTGAAPEVLVPHRDPAALEVGGSLEHPTADRAVLVRVLAELTERLARQLAARDQGAVLLVCALRYAGGELLLLRVGLVEPSASARQLMELVELHLETVALAGEVAHVELRAAVIGRLGERQGELFVDRWPTDPHQLALLVNRLASRLGYERVLRPRLRASPVPERAVGYEPAVGRDKETGRQGDKEKRRRRPSPCPPLSVSPCLSSLRPLLLYPEPVAIEVICVAPDGPPQFVWLEGRRERIVGCTGPERIETLWWRGPTVRRDYYRVVLESTAPRWIFRRLTDGRWFLHGIFA